MSLLFTPAPFLTFNLWKLVLYQICELSCTRCQILCVKYDSHPKQSNFFKMIIINGAKLLLLWL